MKKWLFLGIVALAGSLWADRTANQGWVQKNFSPSNLVGRVEALESAPAPAETDPVFAHWQTNNTIVAGRDASTSPHSVVLGNGAKAAAPRGIAIGRDAVVSAGSAVQLSSGTNSTPGTLQFKDYTVIDASGKIPSERLPAITELDPAFGAWTNSTSFAIGTNAECYISGVAFGSGTYADECAVAVGASAQAIGYYSVSIGKGSAGRGANSVAIGCGSEAAAGGTVQLGEGRNETANTLQFKNFSLVDATGQIPAARMSNALSGYLPLYVPTTTTSAMGYTYSIDKGIEIYDPDASTSGRTGNLPISTMSVNGGIGGSIPRVRYETPVAAFGKGYFYNDYLGVNIDGIYFGADWTWGFDFATKGLTFDHGVNTVTFPTNVTGTVALKGDLDSYIPRDGTGGVFLADQSKWYVGDTNSMFLAIGYKFAGHPRYADDREEWWACSPYAWNFSWNMLRVSGEGVDIGGSLLFDKDYEMMNYLGSDFETLDERIGRLTDTSHCIKYVDNEEFKDIAYPLTKGVVVLNAAGTDSVAELREYCISCKYFAAGDEGTYFGERGNMVLSPEGPSISVDSCHHWMDFQSGKNGTIALTSDINAANVLTAIQAMTAEQKAALKTALGL